MRLQAAAVQNTSNVLPFFFLVCSVSHGSSAIAVLRIIKGFVFWICAGDTAIRFADLVGEQSSSLGTRAGDDGSPVVITFFVNVGRYLLACYADSVAVLWDAELGKALQHYAGPLACCFVWWLL